VGDAQIAGSEPEIRFNPDASAKVLRVGRGEHAVVIIDDVLARPDVFAGYAASARFSAPDAGAYPGLTAALPTNYARALIQALRPILMDGFGLGGPGRFSGFLALATTPLRQLSPLQRMPHFDSPDARKVAIVHYLGRGEFGGTAFYRHVATGLEAVGRAQVARFSTAARPELGHHAHQYTDGTFFQEVGRIDYVFNRLIMYPTNVFHAAVHTCSVLPRDAASGRLTANLFIEPEL
jgi:hypothetical protein